VFFSTRGCACALKTQSVEWGQLCSNVAGMRGIWSLKATSMDAFDTFLVLTFVGETRILGINSEDELDEAEIEGFDSEAQVHGCCPCITADSTHQSRAELCGAELNAHLLLVRCRTVLALCTGSL